MNVEDMTLEELCRHATTLPEAEEGMREAARAELDRIEYKSLAERWEGLERERDQWREFAEGLVRCVRGEDELRPLLFEADFKKALADFDRLQEESK